MPGNPTTSSGGEWVENGAPPPTSSDVLAVTWEPVNHLDAPDPVWRDPVWWSDTVFFGIASYAGLVVPPLLIWSIVRMWL